VDGTSGRRQGAPFAGSHHCASSLSARRSTNLRVRVSHGETRPSHEDGSRPGRLSSRRGCAGYRRRVKTRGGLDGKTVIDRSGVSALGSSPIRQREVLLARVLLPLRAKSVDRKGSTTGAASARDRSVLSFGRKQTPEPLVITELAVCPAKILSPGGSRRRTERRAPARVRRGCRGMRFSARGVAAMTEANGRPRVPHVLRKELAIPGRRASSSFR